MAVDERYVDVGFEMTDTVTCAHTMGLLLAEALTLAGVGTPQGRYRALAGDEIVFRSRLEIDGEVWECVVLNTTGFFPSVYSNFAFNSFCEFNDNAYGADDNGIYELVGDDDEGEEIVTGILFHPTTLGNTLRKKFRKVFVNFTGESPMLEAITDNGRRQFELRRNEANITRDLRGRQWQFAIQGFDSFEYFEAFPIYLSR